MNLKNIPMQRKLAIAFALLLTVAAAMIGAVFFQLSEMRTAARLNAESKAIIEHTHVAEKGVIRLNSQMRGVLLTGNEDYLGVYRKGWEQFEESSAALAAATASFTSDSLASCTVPICCPVAGLMLAKVFPWLPLQNEPPMKLSMVSATGRCGLVVI